MKFHGKTVRAFKESTGEEVQPGDLVVSFRGEAGGLMGVTKLPSPGKSGNVHVQTPDGHNFYNYPQVWGLRLEVED